MLKLDYTVMLLGSFDRRAEGQTRDSLQKDSQRKKNGDLGEEQEAAGAAAEQNHGQTTWAIQ